MAKKASLDALMKLQQGRTGTKNQPGTLNRPTSVSQVNTGGRGVLVTYPTGPHRPTGPLQYRQDQVFETSLVQNSKS